MHPTRIVRPVARRLLVVLLFLTGACTSWHVETMPPAELVAERKPEQVRVRLVDRSRLVLFTPAVLGDSLVGTVDGGRRTVALAEVNEIAVRRGNALGTVGFVGALVAASFATLLILLIISGGPSS
ncbi:MAG TPA: hypothetical protein VLA95_11635 [Gemmatimonadales bacterium]|nr:hypothetical protein [Gemmatimonadales bacterium]